MENDKNTPFLNFASFMKETPDEEFDEIDRACLSHELFEDVDCLKNVLPLYFFLTRNRDSKMPIAELKKRFRCGAELIGRVRKAITEKKPLQVRRRKGVNPVRDNQELVRLVDSITRENGSFSDENLANILGTSKTTVNRIRHDLKYSYRPLHHAPLFTDRHIQKRMEFCIAHQNDNWAKVLFTVESRFATSPDSPVMWWTKRGDDLFLEEEKFHGSIMVWAGIIGNERTRLLKCPSRMNAEKYVELLENNGIVEFLRQQGDRSVFQQDGASCHTAASTKRWFAGQNVALLDGWPANSPDLSPIEQIWGICKRFIVQRFDVRTPLTIQQLETAVFEVFDQIEEKTIKILTLSMQFRVRLCIARNGKFFGDALDENCRRAKELLESTTIIPFQIGGPERRVFEQETEGESREPVAQTRLPSIRNYQ